VKVLDAQQLANDDTIQAGIDVEIRTESIHPLEMIELVLSM